MRWADLSFARRKPAVTRTHKEERQRLTKAAPWTSGYREAHVDGDRKALKHHLPPMIHLLSESSFSRVESDRHIGPRRGLDTLRGLHRIDQSVAVLPHAERFQSKRGG